MSTTDIGAEKPTTTPAVVIYNGPSRAVWQGHEFPGAVIGCNFAYRDFDLTHCMAVDRMTMAAIRGELEDQPYPCEFWTKTSSLELPEPWQQRPQLGIDSGSAAIELALTLTQGPVIVVGADGVCGGETHTAYLYPWHGNSNKRNIHSRHARTVIELSKLNPGRIIMVWDRPVEGLETIDFHQALALLNKYTITEDPQWPSQP